MWSVDWSVGGREWISTPPFFVSMQDDYVIEYLERIGFGGLEAVEKKTRKRLAKSQRWCIVCVLPKRVPVYAT